MFSHQILANLGNKLYNWLSSFGTLNVQMAMHLVHSKDLETKQQRKELGLCLQKTPSQSLTSNIESAHAIQLSPRRESIAQSTIRIAVMCL